jgi:hypothetical protein
MEVDFAVNKNTNVFNTICTKKTEVIKDISKYAAD